MLTDCALQDYNLQIVLLDGNILVISSQRSHRTGPCVTHAASLSNTHADHRHIGTHSPPTPGLTWLYTPLAHINTLGLDSQSQQAKTSYTITSHSIAPFEVNHAVTRHPLGPCRHHVCISVSRAPGCASAERDGNGTRHGASRWRQRWGWDGASSEHGWNGPSEHCNGPFQRDWDGRLEHQHWDGPPQQHWDGAPQQHWDGYG